MGKSSNSVKKPDADIFPYAFLMRFSWPDHIESLMRRLIWLWLTQQTRHPQMPQEEFETVGGYVCWLITLHPDTPPAVLEVLSQQNCQSFCERVAENPATWPTTLSRLAKHQSVKVRTAVAGNHNTPPEAVVVLANDESADVRFAVAENANHPAYILEALCLDENCHVAERSKRTLAKLYLEKVHYADFPAAVKSSSNRRKASISSG